MDGISKQGIGSLQLSATDCLTSELQLHERARKEAGLVSGEDIPFRPPLLNNGPIEFNIGGNTSRYMQLSTSRICGFCKVTKEDGTNIANNEGISVVNMFGPSLFQKMEMSVGGLPIPNLTCDMFHYKDYIETIESYGRDAAAGHLRGKGFRMDDFGKFDDVGTYTPYQAPVAEIPIDLTAIPPRPNITPRKPAVPEAMTASLNGGFRDRTAMIAGSRVFDFAFNLGQAFFQVDRLVPGRIPMTIRLTRAKDAFSILAPAGRTNNYKIVITELTLYIRAIQVRAELQLVNERKWLSDNPFLYYMTTTVVKPMPASVGLSSIILPQLFEGPLPKHIIVGQVLSAAYDGDYGLNPYNFQHFDTSMMCLKVNGAAKPNDPYRPNFTEKLYMREYIDSQYNTGINHDNLGNCITYELFGGGAYLQPFDLSPNGDNGFQLHELGTGNVELQINWRTPLAKPVTIIAYASYDMEVQVDKNSRVAMTYASLPEDADDGPRRKKQRLE
jgi:hypothetical protein